MRVFPLLLAVLVAMSGCASTPAPAAPVSSPSSGTVVMGQPPVPTTSGSCGQTEGSMISNRVHCVALTRQGTVEPSDIDVGSPHRRDLTCDSGLELWGEDFVLRCDAVPFGDPDAPSFHDGLQLSLVSDARSIVLWQGHRGDAQWASVRVEGDRALFSFRMLRLD